MEFSEDGAELLVLDGDHGEPAARISLYRLVVIDSDRLALAVVRGIAALPVGARHQVTTAINAGVVNKVHAPPDEDHVTIEVAGIVVAHVHRRELVPSWPADE